MIETERLILRPVDPDRDFEGWAQMMADPVTMRGLGGEPLDRAQAWRSMAMTIGHWQIRGYGFFSLEEKKTGNWVGRVGPWNPEGWPAPEVGWTISPQFRRRGYAVEAGAASIAFAFGTLRWKRVIHVILEDNFASVGVAEKLGSRRLSCQQGLPGVTDKPVLIYGQDAP